MALVGKNFVFFHMPRTGGTWVRHALRLADPAAEEVGDSHCLPGSLPDQNGKVRVTILREPITWLESWNSLLSVYRDDMRDIPAVLLADDLERRIPEVYASCRANSDIVLSTESLDDELPRLLDDLGFDSGEVIKNIPPAARNRRTQWTDVQP